MSTTTRIRVIDSVFDCEDCANTIERVLLKQMGVEAVATADHEQKLEIRFDRSQIGEDRLKQLVDEWGYTPEPLPG